MIDDILASKAFYKRSPVRHDYYKYIFNEVTPIDGLWLEFGVYNGTTLEELAQYAPDVIYGFDSFEGLPEKWIRGYGRGHFKIDNPRKTIETLANRISKAEIVWGYFEDTLPRFINDHPQNCAVIHIDCDLYESTKTVFAYLKDRIVSGTIILFDEIHHYAGYEEHEYRAFSEFLDETDLQCKWVAHVSNAPQATCIII